MRIDAVAASKISWLDRKFLGADLKQLAQIIAIDERVLSLGSSKAQLVAVTDRQVVVLRMGAAKDRFSLDSVATATFRTTTTGDVLELTISGGQSEKYKFVGSRKSGEEMAGLIQTILGGETPAAAMPVSAPGVVGAKQRRVNNPFAESSFVKRHKKGLLIGGGVFVALTLIGVFAEDEKKDESASETSAQVKQPEAKPSARSVAPVAATPPTRSEEDLRQAAALKDLTAAALALGRLRDAAQQEKVSALRALTKSLAHAKVLGAGADELKRFESALGDAAGIPRQLDELDRLDAASLPDVPTQKPTFVKPTYDGAFRISGKYEGLYVGGPAIMVRHGADWYIVGAFSGIGQVTTSRVKAYVIGKRGMTGYLPNGGKGRMVVLSDREQYKQDRRAYAKKVSAAKKAYRQQLTAFKAAVKARKLAERKAKKSKRRRDRLRSGLMKRIDRVVASFASFDMSGGQADVNRSAVPAVPTAKTWDDFPTLAMTKLWPLGAPAPGDDEFKKRAANKQRRKLASEIRSTTYLFQAVEAELGKYEFKKKAFPLNVTTISDQENGAPDTDWKGKIDWYTCACRPKAKNVGRLVNSRRTFRVFAWTEKTTEWIPVPEALAENFAKRHRNGKIKVDYLVKYRKVIRDRHLFVDAGYRQNSAKGAIITFRKIGPVRVTGKKGEVLLDTLAKYPKITSSPR